MFDISWTEFLLIGVVALIVIGPKELPGVLRTLGQWTRKLRSMANEFQGQFQEAMREAEMADLKKDVDDMAKDFGHFDPLKDVRDSVDSMSRDFEKSIATPASPSATPLPSEPAAEVTAGAAPALTQAPAEAPMTTTETSTETSAETTAPVASPEPATAAAEPAGTERSA
jgi:sec-independent protein translocase protein TatB